MMKIGYARVSSEDQKLTIQLEALKKRPDAPESFVRKYLELTVTGRNSTGCSISCARATS
jgi:predicted site-specific integrase-resolvase